MNDFVATSSGNLAAGFVLMAPPASKTLGV